MNQVITIPILLIGFNRPEIINETFSYIRKAKPEKLFVAIDGPRENRAGEDKLVNDVKKIVKVIDWACEVHYKYNDTNLGAEITVSSAVSWVLENEDYVIVLEDDIIAPISFFNFAQDMLYKYKDDESIYMISSCQTTPIELPNDEDYLFGIYGHTWGWATWKRAWVKFNLSVNDFDDFLKSRKIDELSLTNKEKKYWYKLVKKMRDNGEGNNNWDYCWSYIRFKERGLSIIPRVHLSSNIGTFGLHANGKTDHHFRLFDEKFEVRSHPVDIKRNTYYDNVHFNDHINRKLPLYLRFKNKLLKIIKLYKKGYIK